MKKLERLRREDLEPIIQRLAVLNRGFDLTTNQVIEYESCLERLPTLGHADRVITIAIERHTRPPAPAELLSIYREIAVAARPDDDCTLCDGSGWRPVTVEGHSAVRRCGCIRQRPAPPRFGHPPGERHSPAIAQLAQEKTLS